MTSATAKGSVYPWRLLRLLFPTVFGVKGDVQMERMFLLHDGAHRNTSIQLSGRPLVLKRLLKMEGRDCGHTVCIMSPLLTRPGFQRARVDSLV